MSKDIVDMPQDEFDEGYVDVENIPEDEILWHTLHPQVVLAQWETTLSGLHEDEAVARLKKYGPNRLSPGYKPGFLRKVWAQVNNILTAILIVAAIVVAILSEWYELGLIILVVVLNVTIGLIQEGKAEKSAEALKAMLSSQAVVVRGGERVSVDAEEVVPGDIVALTAGERVPADIRLVAISGPLACQESMLTGESVPVAKSLKAVAADAPLGDRVCMAFSATLVTGGSGLGVVVATGDNAEVGKISSLVGGVESGPTHLAVQLEYFGRFIAVGTILLAVGSYLVVKLWRNYDSNTAVNAAATIAVSIIPEGLPAVVTVCLAIASQHMAARNAIVRQLAAVETLGSVTVICSDKTGTLTKNEMTAVRVIAPWGDVEVTGVGYDPIGEFRVGREMKGNALVSDTESDMKEEAPRLTAEQMKKLYSLIVGGALCHEGGLTQDEETGVWNVMGDPTDAAPLVLMKKAGVRPDSLQVLFPQLASLPFDSDYKFAASLHRIETKDVPTLIAKAGITLEANEPEPPTPLSFQGDEMTRTTSTAGSLKENEGLEPLASTPRVPDMSVAIDVKDAEMAQDPGEPEGQKFIENRRLRELYSNENAIMEIIQDTILRDAKEASLQKIAGTGDNHTPHLLIVKGAPEVVLPMCKYQPSNAGLPGKNECNAMYWSTKAADLSGRGLRVIAVAHGYTPGPKEATGTIETGEEEDVGVVSDSAEVDNTLSADDLLKQPPFLSFNCLIAILDPPREECVGAIAQCHNAGIQVKMITGDHPSTAMAIAKMLGIVDPNSVQVEYNTAMQTKGELAKTLMGIPTHETVGDADMNQNPIVVTESRRASMEPGGDVLPLSRPGTPSAAGMGAEGNVEMSENPPPLTPIRDLRPTIVGQSVEDKSPLVKRISHPPKPTDFNAMSQMLVRPDNAMSPLRLPPSAAALPPLPPQAPTAHLSPSVTADTSIVFPQEVHTAPSRLVGKDVPRLKVRRERTVGSTGSKTGLWRAITNTTLESPTYMGGRHFRPKTMTSPVEIPPVPSPNEASPTFSPVSRLLTEGGIQQSQGRVLTKETTALVIKGTDVDKMTEEQLKEVVFSCHVYARASPETKLRILRALQSAGAVTSMTGDGVNDAPALKAADVGCAMGITGTDVAKEASKVVLADDNFSTIVQAVKEGRVVWDNLTKVLLVAMPTNMAQGLVIFFSYIVNLPTPPVTGMQVLWTNLLTSVTLGVVLTFEPAEPSVMDRKPRPPDARLLSAFVVFRTTWVCVLIVVLVSLQFFWSLEIDYSWNRSRTTALNTLVISQCFYAISCRFLTGTAFTLDIFRGNIWFWIGFFVAICLQIFLTYTPGVQHIFNTAFINGLDWLRVFGFSIFVFLVVEVEKAIGPRYIYPRALPVFRFIREYTPRIAVPVFLAKCWRRTTRKLRRKRKEIVVTTVPTEVPKEVTKEVTVVEPLASPLRIPTAPRTRTRTLTRLTAAGKTVETFPSPVSIYARERVVSEESVPETFFPPSRVRPERQPTFLAFAPSIWGLPSQLRPVAEPIARIAHPSPWPPGHEFHPRPASGSLAEELRLRHTQRTATRSRLLSYDVDEALGRQTASVDNALFGQAETPNIYQASVRTAPEAVGVMAAQPLAKSTSTSMLHVPESPATSVIVRPLQPSRSDLPPIGPISSERVSSGAEGPTPIHSPVPLYTSASALEAPHAIVQFVSEDGPGPDGAVVVPVSAMEEGEHPEFPRALDILQQRTPITGVQPDTVRASPETSGILLQRDVRLSQTEAGPAEIGTKEHGRTQSLDTVGLPLYVHRPSVSGTQLPPIGPTHERNISSYQREGSVASGGSPKRSRRTMSSASNSSWDLSLHIARYARTPRYSGPKKE